MMVPRREPGWDEDQFDCPPFRSQMPEVRLLKEDKLSAH